jgi:hypothetical protein
MRRLKNYLYFVGLFFLIFSPHIMVFGVVVKTVYVFIVAPGLAGIYLYSKARERNIVETRTLSFMFLSLLYFIALSGIGTFQEISVVKEILMGVIILFACFFYVHYYHKIHGNSFVTHIFFDLNMVGVCHSCIVIATFLWPSFKRFLYDYVSVTERSMRYLFGEVENERYQGIAVSGFGTLSTTHALLLVAGVWALYMDNRRLRTGRVILFWLRQLLIVVAIGLIGRTGFVIVLVFVGALFALRAREFLRDMRVSSRTIKSAFAILVLSVTVFLTVDVSRYSRNIDYAFETVIRFKESREFDGSTTEVLQNQWIFPDTIVGVLFGTSNFGRSDELTYIPSDVGYVLFIFGAGIFGMFVAYGFYLVGLYYAYRFRVLYPYLSAYIVIFLFALIILNLKDYYFISYAGHSQIYFIMLCALGKAVACQHSTSMKIRSLTLPMKLPNGRENLEAGKGLGVRGSGSRISRSSRREGGRGRWSV